MARPRSTPRPGPPHHQWPGVVVACELALAAAGALVIAAGAFMFGYGLGGVMIGMMMAVPVAFCAVGCGLLAWGVWHFEPWALWAGLLLPAVLAAWLAFTLYRMVSTAGSLWVVPAAAALLAVMLVQGICWLYLWRRWPDFDDAPPWPGPAGHWLRR